MQTISVNLDGDWSNAELMIGKASGRRWCPACHEEHDLACFFRYRGQHLGCMLNKGSRSKAMAKIKGGIKG
uniref:Uncharacterized protein n=1 Tax=viral metagenome TaxID=1070528 RepID=A0A6M3IS25_9ZZZZ